MERRNYERMAMSFSVRVSEFNSQKKLNPFDASHNTAINISGNGILVNSLKKINIGKEVRLTFLKPNTFELFKTNGKVIRVNENFDNTYDLGINFNQLTDNEKNDLDFYINIR